MFSSSSCSGACVEIREQFFSLQREYRLSEIYQCKNKVHVYLIQNVFVSVQLTKTTFFISILICSRNLFLQFLLGLPSSCRVVLYNINMDGLEVSPTKVTKVADWIHISPSYNFAPIHRQIAQCPIAHVKQFILNFST